MARRARVWLVAVAGCGLLVQGCGDGGGGTAQVRVVHLSQEVGAVDLLVNGASVETGVPEMSVAGYVTVRAGQTSRLVAHATAGGAADVVTTATLEAGGRYDVALFDAEAGPAMQVVGFGPEGSFRVIDLATGYSGIDVALVKAGTVVAEAQVQPRYSLVFPQVGSGIAARLTTVDAKAPAMTTTLGPDLAGKEAFVTDLRMNGQLVGVGVREVDQ